MFKCPWPRRKGDHAAMEELARRDLDNMTRMLRGAQKKSTGLSNSSLTFLTCWEAQGASNVSQSMGLYWDNGKLNGNYYLGFRV